MTRYCFFCHGTLGANRVLESFASVSRAAFDPRRGRLWAVCAGCRRWTLAPIEERWEIVENLERLTRDGATVLGRTENIGLFRVGDLEIVRIGAAPRREQAWWRYGREVRERQSEVRRIIRRGKVKEALFATMLFGFPFWGFRSPETWINRARSRRFGSVVWRGASTCDLCGVAEHTLEFDNPVCLWVRDQDAGVQLQATCARCRRRRRHGSYELSGTTAEYVLRRMLAYQNFDGAPEWVVSQAVALIDEGAPSNTFRTSIGTGRTTLYSLASPQRIALEIVTNEIHEEAMMTTELHTLEKRWREEEEIAAIADSELTPAPHRRL